jgi:hypothetical protein
MAMQPLQPMVSLRRGRDRQGFLWPGTTKYHLVKRHVRRRTSKQACKTSRGYGYTDFRDTVKLPSSLRMPIDQGLQLLAYRSSVLSAEKTIIYSADERNDEVVSFNGSCHATFLRKRTARARHGVRNKGPSARKTAVTVCRIDCPATLADSLIPRHGDSGWIGERNGKAA